MTLVFVVVGRNIKNVAGKFVLPNRTKNQLDKIFNEQRYNTKHIKHS